MTTVPNVVILADMGRWHGGLLLSVAFAAGCAAAAPPEEVQEQSGGNGDMSGGTVVQDCTDGGSCDTGNPGDCSMGHTVCSGDVQSCVPDVTTQRCYDGPANTANVGICAAGMQTCIGATGTCQGEVLPAAQEDCFNDLDDDCDGVVNNGCPDHLTTGTPVGLTARGDTSGGTAFSLRCPANNVVSKIIVYGDDTDEAVGGIDVFCSSLTLVRGASTYTVTETQSATALTRHAGDINTGEAGPFDCGTTGFAPASYVNGQATSAEAIFAFGSSCSTGALALGTDNKLTITFTKQASLTDAGYGIGTAYEDDCAAGSVLIGYDGRSNSYMNSLQPICAPIQTVYK